MRRGQPVDRRQGREGPGGHDAESARRRDIGSASNTALLAVDRRPRDRRGGRKGCRRHRRARRAADRHKNADARRRIASGSRGDGTRRGSARVKVAIVGGTGAFGRALATRLAEIGRDDVVVGSRDPERGRSTAEELGVAGGRNQEVVRDVDLVVLAVKSNATLETAAELADAIGKTPVLCVASDLRFTEAGVLPGRHQGSLAEEVARIVRGPVVSGFQSFAAANVVQGDPGDALICGEDSDAKTLALELAEHLGARGIDAGPLANSRALEGMTSVILNVNRRYKAHAGIRLTGLP
ncbi:MAG: hypothetical protein E6G26_00140 [Actinobacteria bacterium]|nr:MAG: hypothetical protein E6G26_00140 [Actinomycetota bacterium]